MMRMFDQVEAPSTEYEKEEESNAVPVSSGPDSSTTAEYERGDSAQTQDDGGLGSHKAVLLLLLVTICSLNHC